MYITLNTHTQTHTHKYDMQNEKYTESGYCLLFRCILIFLTVEEGTIAAKTHWIINVARLNQPI